MADPVTTLTASAIATLAFQEFIKSGAGELAKETISKMSELRQKISDRLRGKHEMAEESLQKATAGNEQAINTVATLLGVEMLNPEFAAEIQAIAQEINVRILRDSSSMVQQTNHPHSVGIQAYVEKGAIANFGLNLNIPDSITRDELSSAIKAIWESILSTEIPKNVPHSGVAKFVGRETEMERLHTQLQQGIVSISAVEGMGGLGKTELAIQYTQQYASTYKGGICWLSARKDNIGEQVVEFARSHLYLKIPEGLKLTNQVLFCYRNWREGEVLLVLDDVVNLEHNPNCYSD